MLRPIRIADPAGDLVTLEAVKNHLSVSFNDDDSVIADLIDGAVSMLDGYNGFLGRCIISQDWQVSFANWPDEFVRLPFPNIQSVTIEYDDVADATELLSEEEFSYGDDELGGFVQFTGGGVELSNVADRPVRIQFTAGFGTAAYVPGEIKTAVTLLVSHWYHNREGQGEIPESVEALISVHRWSTV